MVDPLKEMSLAARIKQSKVGGNSRGRVRRSGRPSVEQTEKLDRHLLDVAERNFLSMGFTKASIDGLAVAASASKKTIYHRFAGKEALFHAVVERAVDRYRSAAESIIFSGGTIEERLEHLAFHILTETLRQELVDLMRVVIPEIPRFESLAKKIDDSGRRPIYGLVVGFLNNEVAAGNIELSDSADIVSSLFIAMIDGSRFLSVLLGRDLDEVKAEAFSVVKPAVTMFLKGCRRS